MGYDTQYFLSVMTESEEHYKSIKTEVDAAVLAIDDGLFEDGTGGEWFAYDAKWYTQEEDMYRLSVQFPKILWCLHGDGDDSDDLWDEYWQDGRMQHCHMEIPPLDKSAMVQYYLDENGRFTRVPPIQEEIECPDLSDIF